jgi:hypothetical protein
MNFSTSGCVFKRVQNLECVLETEGGMISFDFYNGVDGLYFAKAVTMVPAREALIKKPLKFPANFVGEDVGALAQELLPLFPDETVRCNFRGKSGLSKFAGFCVVGEHNVFIEALNAVRNLQGDDPIYYWCSKEILGCCWPWLPYFLTCCLRPFIYQEQLLITDTAVLTLRTTRNYGLCGFRPLDKMESTLCGPQEMCFAKQGDFELAWSPLSNMNGHNFGIAFGGSETCITRCCKGNICGRICCPISR